MPTYPKPAQTLTASVLQTHTLLNSPTYVSRRLRDVAEQRFIGDAILPQRMLVEGGAVVFETGESIYADRNVQAIPPGSEYPLTTTGDAGTSIAQVVKWGEDTVVTDEAIKRLRINAVENAMAKLVNQTVKHVDSIALSAVSSAVTTTRAAAATWALSTAEQIISDVMQSVASVRGLNDGFEPDTVVSDDARWAFAMAKFIAAGLTPRESADTALLTGQYPTILGLRWLATPNLPVAGQALVLDSTQLGGMADEDLGGPGYVGEVRGIEGKAIREDLKDAWLLRARRVTVPVVLNPSAAVKITGVGV